MILSLAALTVKPDTERVQELEQEVSKCHKDNSALNNACMELLDIVECEYESDPEPDDLVSWNNAIEDARLAISQSNKG
jgi:hypothetical protein